jgi:hypothetical protein
MVVAVRSQLVMGWGAMDDFEFLYDPITCPNLPIPPSTTTGPTPSPTPHTCPAGEEPCGGGKGCFAQRQKCDFFNDCMYEATDELGCPNDYFFDNCGGSTSMQNCGWEELSHDALDWIIAEGLCLQYIIPTFSQPTTRAGPTTLWNERAGGSGSKRRLGFKCLMLSLGSAAPSTRTAQIPACSPSGNCLY